MQLNYREMLDYGVEILSSGTTGEKKHILRSPDNLEACNKVAIEVQMITAKSRIYTCTKMDHAGGLLLQTLPAYTLGCDIKITTFNPYQFLTEFQDYTHTFLPPKMCQAVMQTKAFLHAIYLTRLLQWVVIELMEMKYKHSLIRERQSLLIGE